MPSPEGQRRLVWTRETQQALIGNTPHIIYRYKNESGNYIHSLIQLTDAQANARQERFRRSKQYAFSPNNNFLNLTTETNHTTRKAYIATRIKTYLEALGNPQIPPPSPTDPLYSFTHQVGLRRLYEIAKKENPVVAESVAL